MTETKTRAMDLVSGTRWNETNGQFEHRSGVDHLTKREHFASLALQGLLASSSGTVIMSDYISDAVNLADALIEALNKETT